MKNPGHRRCVLSKVPLYSSLSFCQMSTNVHNSFIVRLSSKSATKSLLKISQWLRCVATLPCEIYGTFLLKLSAHYPCPRAMSIPWPWTRVSFFDTRVQPIDTGVIWTPVSTAHGHGCHFLKPVSTMSFFNVDTGGHFRHPCPWPVHTGVILDARVDGSVYQD